MTSNKMDAFVDESGVDRQSGHSIYCITLCPSGNRQELDLAVRTIEERLKIPPFHWREQSWQIKISFLNAIIKLPEWSCIICFADNRQKSHDDLTFFLEKALIGMEIERLYLDGWKSKQYEQAFKKSLKTLGLSVSTLKTARFSAVGGLRISDAIAGLARIAVDGKLDDDVSKIYRRLIDKKTTTQILSGHLTVRPPHGR